MAKLFASLMVLAVGLGGLIPRWTAYRCARMAAISSRSCCAAHSIEDVPDERTISRACCEAFEAPAQGDRIAPESTNFDVGPAPFAGLLPVSLWAVVTKPTALLARGIDAAPPPTRSVLDLSTVLRI